MSAQTVADLCSHVETLCSKHSIALEYRRSGGRSWRKTRRISVGPVLSNVTYAVALHEIGHILGRSPARRLDREASAWQWARENALEWTPRMEAKMQSCLDSYAKWFLETGTKMTNGKKRDKETKATAKATAKVTATATPTTAPKIGTTTTTTAPRIKAELSITSYIHCSRCIDEWLASDRSVSPADYSRTQSGFTELGLQVWCNRHNVNVVHIDFQGARHPANMTVEDTTAISGEGVRMPKSNNDETGMRVTVLHDSYDRGGERFQTSDGRIFDRLEDALSAEGITDSQPAGQCNYGVCSYVQSDAGRRW